VVERTEELRDDIERRRNDISHTVDELQNRVSPGRVMARGRYRVRRWIVDAKDQIMGNKETHYPWQQDALASRQQQQQRTESKEESMTDRMSQAASEAGDRVSQTASEAKDRVSYAASEVRDTVAQAPQQLRRQTRGNPMAAGLIAFGGGLLLGSILPETRTEQDIAHRIEPAMSNAMAEAREAGSEVMEDVKQDAEHAMQQVKEKGSEAVQHLKEDAKETAERTRDRTQG
jgi:gas vesicle protein